MIQDQMINDPRSMIPDLIIDPQDPMIIDPQDPMIIDPQDPMILDPLICWTLFI